MIYATFSIWMLLLLLAGLGVYRVWSDMIRPRWVNWALLPGTMVSEMAYIFGCLITGGEIRHARLMPAGKGRGRDDGEPTTDAGSSAGFVAPLVASLLAVIASGAAILAVHALLGGPVLSAFTGRAGIGAVLLPTAPPSSWSALWQQLHVQVDLLRRICETLAVVDWGNWRIPLFVYLSLCLAVRLAPVGRDLRAALAAVVLVALLIALAGAVSAGFRGLLERLWPLMSYVWSLLVLMLVVSLITRGLVALLAVLRGRSAPARRRSGRRSPARRSTAPDATYAEAT